MVDGKLSGGVVGVGVVGVGVVAVCRGVSLFGIPALSAARVTSFCNGILGSVLVQDFLPVADDLNKRKRGGGRGGRRGHHTTCTSGTGITVTASAVTGINDGAGFLFFFFFSSFFLQMWVG